MQAYEFNRIGVIGAGTMGRGIAMLLALHGFRVILADREEPILQRALVRILERTDPTLRAEVEERIVTTVIPQRLKVCDLVIEAVYEDEAAKREILTLLGVICREDAVVASNTSAISISRLAESLPNPMRFLGMHFMNPPTAMKLVEVVRGEKTADAVVRAITALSERLGKVPVVIRDTPGFVANRLLFAQIGEALRLLESGAATKEDIDTVMKLGLNHPLGPFELADFIGLDVCFNILAYLCETLADESYRPGDILGKLVREGKLGKKTGEGFYRYS
jgi:3-hydroxybutyryl-CoA dehydrogenase